MLPYAVMFRGHPACPCQAAWLPVLEAEAQRRGILRGSLPISQLIGGASTSGGTHSKGGASDFYPLTVITDVTAFVALCRELGADATWHRVWNWDGRNGVEHVHTVQRDCPHNTPARYQYDSTTQGVDHGRDGLSHGGRGAPDTGPRPLSGRTWRQGIEWARAQEDDMANYTDWKPADRKALVDDVVAGVMAYKPKGATSAVEQLLKQAGNAPGLIRSLATALGKKLA